MQTFFTPAYEGKKTVSKILVLFNRILPLRSSFISDINWLEKFNFLFKKL